MSLSDRMRQSAKWAPWAPGLVEKAVTGIRRHLDCVNEAMVARGTAGHGSLRALSVEQWRDHSRRGHIPFNRERRTCLEEMGSDTPHRRRTGGGSSFVMSVDAMGPYTKGNDLGDQRRIVKYALVATIPIPVGDTEVTEDPEGHSDEAGEAMPWEALDAGAIEVAEEEARELNQAAALVEGEKDPVKVKNVTFVEPMEPRHASHFLFALQSIHARARSLGIPVFRLLIVRRSLEPIRKWLSDTWCRSCREMTLRLMAGSGMRPIQEEIQVAYHSGAPPELWPSGLRFAEEMKMASPGRCVVTFQVCLVVPLMTGWVVKDSDGRI